MEGDGDDTNTDPYPPNVPPECTSQPNSVIDADKLNFPCSQVRGALVQHAGATIRLDRNRVVLGVFLLSPEVAIAVRSKDEAER